MEAPISELGVVVENTAERTKMPRRVAFVHIPRTAGTSATIDILNSAGTENAFHWSREKGFEPYSSDNKVLNLRSNPRVYALKEKLLNTQIGPIKGGDVYRTLRGAATHGKKEEKNDLPAGPNSPLFVVGHFSAAEIRRKIPDISLISVMRDPFARLVSEYEYRLALGNLEDVSFEAFLEKPDNINAQSKMLGFTPEVGLTVNDYFCIGVVDQLPAFYRRLGITASEPKKVNAVRTDRSKYEPMRARFEELNQTDIDLYKQIKSQWTEG